METSDPLLVSARLKIPVPRRQYILRKTLLDLLRQCSGVSIVYICGGAGTGKTTLLSSFIRESDLQCTGWFSIDRSCSNMYSFWLYVVAAFSPFLKNNELLSFVKSNTDTAHIEQVLRTLADELEGTENRYLVLDDLQYVTDTTLVRSLEFFLSILPDNVHIFMLSREKPPVYLGRFAVEGRLLFIGADALQLSEKESLDFLQTTLSLSAGDQDLKKLVSYAEGWIGGLQLAAAASGTGSAAGTAAHSGSLLRGGSIAADYLNREIFESLPAEERQFLVCTGPLSYFDAGICSQCFDGCTVDGFRAIVKSLTDKNLFIVCIDEAAGIYRYHNILSDFLIRQFSYLPEVQRKTVFKKTAAAFEQRGDLPEALRLLQFSEDYEGVMRIASAPGSGIETWSFLDQVPVPQLVRLPDLAFKCFLYNMGILNIERCRVLYSACITEYRGTSLETVMQFAQAYVSKDSSLLPDYSPLTTEQIDFLPLGTIIKAMIYTENASALADRLEYTEAEHCIDKALASDTENRAFIGTYAWGQKAQLYEETGRLNESLSCYHTALQLYNNSSVLSGIGTNFYIGATGVYMRRMELGEAQRMLDESCRIYEGRHGPVDVINMTVTSHRAEMEFLRGNAEQGKRLVDSILENYPELNVLNLGRLLMEESCADILDTGLAQLFLQHLASSPESYRSILFMRLLEARIVAAVGKPDDALAETDDMLAASRRTGNRLRLTEGGLQKLYLLERFPEKEPDEHKKIDLLRETVSYAWENRILMPYFLERTTVLPLLRKLLSLPAEWSGLSSGERRFTEEAVAVCSGFVPGSSADTALAGVLPDVLSPREYEVLEALALGITNKEIAARLCISLATVKTHIINIYAKLGVSSRVMAVDEAVKRGILQRVRS
jgi:LuxR family transcriptional regulator, maltose regulon positive regulatory protein